MISQEEIKSNHAQALMYFVPSVFDGQLEVEVSRVRERARRLGGTYCGLCASSR